MNKLIEDTKAKQYSMEDMISFAMDIKSKGLLFSDIDTDNVIEWHNRKVTKPQYPSYDRVNDSNIGKRFQEDAIDDMYDDLCDASEIDIY